MRRHGPTGPDEADERHGIAQRPGFKGFTCCCRRHEILLHYPILKMEGKRWNRWFRRMQE